MEPLAELKKWVESLSKSERRMVSLLGKARSGKVGSQVLDLFDWICEHDADAELRPGLPFSANLGTNVSRLKDLILDALHLVQQGSSVDAALQTALTRIQLLLAKRLYAPAGRLLKRAKAQANACSRHALLLALLDREEILVKATAQNLRYEEMALIHREREDAMGRLRSLMQLQQCHDQLSLISRQVFMPRDAGESSELEAEAQDSFLESMLQAEGYLERALASDTLGLKYLRERRTRQAVDIYADLLRQWSSQPDWQRDQPNLLLRICNNFQSACFFADFSLAELTAMLALVPDFKVLEPDVARGHQRMLFYNQLIPAMNTGNFSLLEALIPRIDEWISEQKGLTEAQQLPFLHNFAISKFLMGQYSNANRYVQRILNMENRQVRQDIRDFALVLQAILHFEMGDDGLGEYLTRAGRRHFIKKSNAHDFEVAVFRYLEASINMGAPQGDALTELMRQLETLAQRPPDNVSFLGLNEVLIWATAKQHGIPIQEAFLQMIRENMEQME